MNPKKLREMQREEEKKKLMYKDPQFKQIAIDCGMTAAKNAIIAGKSQEDALQIAQQAIEQAIKDYKPRVSTAKGVEIAAKIIEEWVERENEKNNIFTCELDVNDYPQNARSKVCRKEYLSQINEMTGCTVTVRGVFVEPGKKTPIGQKRLHMYIQGNTKLEVMEAYKEIKKLLDEVALNYYTMGNQKQTGRYQI